MSAKNEFKPGYPSSEEIAATAYGIWEQEGRPEGRDLQHWLQAEAQLRAVRQPEAPSVIRPPARKPLVAVKSALDAAGQNPKGRTGNRFHAAKLAA